MRQQLLELESYEDASPSIMLGRWVCRSSGIAGQGFFGCDDAVMDAAMAEALEWVG